MKSKLNSTFLALVMLAAIAVFPVFGQEVSRSIKLNRDGRVGDKSLTKGDYTLKFTEDKEGDLLVMKGSKEVLKTAYKITQLGTPAQDTSVIFTAASDGTFQVKRIEFKGKTAALVFE
jgi:hypothetical protein